MPFMIYSAQNADYMQLRKLALKYSLFNLPADRELLKKKIALSEASFRNRVISQKKSFMFVIKNKKGDIVGSSQLLSQVGSQAIPRYSTKLKSGNRGRFLQLSINRNGPSYLGGLIVKKKYRNHPDKLGKQISLIRFLFIKMHLKYFKKTIQAEIDPLFNQIKSNTFFDYFVKKRQGYSTDEANYLTLTNKKKLFDNFPSGKFYLSSLPKSVKKCIGQTNTFSNRALNLLKKQNFYIIDEMDPLDGGPYVEAQINCIPIVQNTKKVDVRIISKSVMLKKNKAKNFSVFLWGKEGLTGVFTGGLLKGILSKNNPLLYLTQKECQEKGLTSKDQIYVVSSRWF